MALLVTTTTTVMMIMMMIVDRVVCEHETSRRNITR